MEEIPKFSVVERETTRLCSGVPVSDPDFLLQQLSWVRNLAKQMHRHLPSSVAIEDLVSAGVIGRQQTCSVPVLCQDSSAGGNCRQSTRK